MNYTNKKILIQGVGISNIAVIKFLANKNVSEIIVTDLKDEEDCKKAVKEIKEIYPEAKFVLGKHKEADFINADLIIRNASIPINIPLLQKAIKNNVQIETDVSLFFKESPSKNIIGITGTKGKTTTAYMVAQMLKDQGKNVVIGGNMGIPVIDELEKIDSETWCVLELSSWQVESIERHKISPTIAIYTSLFEDHLNKYKSYEAYKNAKKGLYLNQKAGDVTFLNETDEELKKYSQEIRQKLIYYSHKELPGNTEVKLKGIHYQNIAGCIYKLGSYLKLDMDKVLKTIKTFKGVEHRMENLGVINGIEFINNTAATNPTAFEADLNELAKEKRPVFLISGGADKKLDTIAIVKLINNLEIILKVAFFKGSATEKLINQINPNKILGVYDSMPDAFTHIVTTAEKYEKPYVFLNPGCASFGVFDDEFDRGNQFKAQVENYK